jgi:hypothetical protein
MKPLVLSHLLTLVFAVSSGIMAPPRAAAGDHDEPATATSVFADHGENYHVRVKIRNRNQGSPKRVLPIRAFKIIDPTTPTGVLQFQEVSPGSIGADSTVKIPKGKAFGSFKFKPKNLTHSSVMFMIFNSYDGSAGYAVVAVKPKPGEAETSGVNTPIGVGRH